MFVAARDLEDDTRFYRMRKETITMLAIIFGENIIF